MNIFNYYVIHIKNKKDRFENIKNMEQKLGIPIEIFYGIDGNSDDINNISKFDSNLNLKNKFDYNGIIGCYLSHFLLLKQIYNNNFNNEYSVIFEDDFDIQVNDLNDKINDAINNIDIDFDFIFLGIEGCTVGDNYKNNLYFINKTKKTWGFQGYVVKNKNIYKILKQLYNIIFEVDIQIFFKIKSGDLNGFFIHPNYINQNKDFVSLIRPSSKNKYVILLKKNCIEKSTNTVPKKVNTVPKKVNTVPKKVNTVPKKVNTVPKKLNTVPKKVNTVPKKLNTVPKKVNTVPKKVNTVPKKVNTVPKKLNIIPKKVNTVPKKLNIIPKKVNTVPKNKLYKK